MKHLIIFFFVLLVAVGCKKSEDANPDPAARIAGTYTLASISQGPVTINYPFTQSGVTRSGTIVVTRKTATTVDLTITLKTTGQADDVDSVSGVDVNGNDLSYGGQKVGTADGSTFTLTETSSGVTSTVIARK